MSIMTDALPEGAAEPPPASPRWHQAAAHFRAWRDGDARAMDELVRLMTREGHFIVKEDGVRFLSNTAYAVNLQLPSDVVNGRFLVRTLVLKDQQVVTERTESFSVRKSGFENYVYVASRQQPLLYGIVCVLLAIGTGWLAGVAFKR